MKHTSLPWSINTKALGLIESESAHRSCASASSYSDGSEAAHEENEANAAFIVKACNNHQKLLDAMKGLVASISGGEKPCGHDFTCVCAGDAAREAIKAAE